VTKKLKHNIALFYVALMLLFKVGGLHALTHQADDTDVQHCELCLVTTAVGFTPVLETETPVLPPTDYYFHEQKRNSTAPQIVLNDGHLASYRFTRPPPLVS